MKILDMPDSSRLREMFYEKKEEEKNKFPH
jgi:hypothetical protein